MKKIACLCVICAFAVMGSGCATLGYLGESSQRQPRMDRPMTGTLKLGSKILPLVFEDGDYTEELRKVIIADMNLIFGHLGDYQFLKLHEPVWFVIGGRKIKAVEHIDFKGPGRSWPDEYSGEARSRLIGCWFIVRLESKPYWVVERELIKAYRKTLDLRKKEPKGFKALDEFIKAYNGGKFLKLPPEKLEDLLFFADIKMKEEGGTRGIIEDFRKTSETHRLRSPSLLKIKKVDTSKWDNLPDVGVTLFAHMRGYYRKHIIFELSLIEDKDELINALRRQGIFEIPRPGYEEKDKVISALRNLPLFDMLLIYHNSRWKRIIFDLE